MKKKYTILDLQEFYKTHNRLPNSNSKQDWSLYYWMNKERKRENKEVEEFLESIGYKSLISRTITDLQEFYKIHNRLPKPHQERSLYQWIDRERRKGNRKILEFLKSINYKSKNFYTISDLIEFYKSNNRLPNGTIKNEKSLYEWMNRERKRENKEVEEFLKSIGYKSRNSYTTTDLIEFYKTYNRLPSKVIKQDRGLYRWMYRERKKGNKEVLNFLSLVNNRDIPEIKELLLTL